LRQRAAGCALAVLSGVFALGLSGCGMVFDPESNLGGQLSPFSSSEAGDPSEMALAALARGDFSRAEVNVNAALRRNPKDPYALLAGAILYHNTDRPQQARRLYEAILTLRPQGVTTIPPGQRLSPRGVVDVAEANLQLLREGQSAAVPEDGMMSQRPLPPSRSGTQYLNGPPTASSMSKTPVRMDQAGDSNAAQRFAVLRRLAEEGLVTEEEYRKRRESNLGALLPLTQPQPAVGLDRPPPPAEQVIDRLRSLARAFEIRAISASEQAAERTMILEGLLPAQPRNKTSLILPPKGLMEGAALVGRLERLRGMGLISAEEQSREREALEKILAALDPPPRPSVSAQAPESMTSQRQTGSTSGSAKSSKSAKGSSSGGKSGVHLASFKSREQADKDWGSLKKAHPELAKLSMKAVKADVKGKGTYWRLVAGPLSSRKAAEDLCRALKSRRQYCDPSSY
jgi:hypothetical protein